MGMKRCPKCNTQKPLTAFHKSKLRKDGLQCYCKYCRTRCARQYREEYRNKVLQSKKEYYQKNRSKVLQQYKWYRGTIKGSLQQVFAGIHQRCNNLNHKAFHNYGGRGIQNRFTSLDDFRDYVINELQVDPRGLQIDRIDNDGHYEKGNIRFVTAKVNANNRRNNQAMRTTYR